MTKYYVVSCHVLWRELCYAGSTSRNTFHLHFLKQGLHNTPDLLRSELQNAIDAVPEGFSAVLIGYGLCSNGLVGITARETPLVIMRGHDCITFLLGSKERYRRHFDACPGTYWYSPGWIDTGFMPGKEGYETVLNRYIEMYGEENAEYLMRATEDWVKNYSRAAYVDLGLVDATHLEQYTKACADALGWDYERVEGDPALVNDFLEGNWDSDRFLIVQPGQRVVATHDDRIIAARPSET